MSLYHSQLILVCSSRVGQLITIGINLDKISKRVVKYTPILEVEFQKRKKAAGTTWRMDETYIKVKGKWRYLYRAVDEEGKTIDFLLTKNRDKLAAKRFPVKSNRQQWSS